MLLSNDNFHKKVKILFSSVQIDKSVLQCK